MVIKRHKIGHYLLGILLLFSLLILATGRIGALDKTQDTAPIRPDDGLSTLPEEDLPEGAQIRLSAERFEIDDWTIVQWQSGDGDWHDIEGWQGTFSPDGTVTWWVAEETLGQTQFRWLVYADESRQQLLSISASFDMPTRNRMVVWVAAE